LRGLQLNNDDPEFLLAHVPDEMRAKRIATVFLSEMPAAHQLASRTPFHTAPPHWSVERFRLSRASRDIIG
jgi:hypothetical protein